MGATMVYNFTCDICGETGSSEITHYLGKLQANLPPGWTRSIRTTKVDAIDPDLVVGYPSQVLTRVLCASCNEDVEHFISGEKKSYGKKARNSNFQDVQASNVRMDKLVKDGGGHNRSPIPSEPDWRTKDDEDLTPGDLEQMRRQGISVDWTYRKVEGRSGGIPDQTDTPVKAPSSPVEPRTDLGEGKDLRVADDALTGPHQTIQGNHHYTLAYNCQYRKDSAYQEGFLCQTCANR